MITPNKNISDIRRTILATFALLAISIIIFILYVYAEKHVDRVNEQRKYAHELSDELRQSSDDLTRMARTYVVTRDPLYKRHFQEIIDIRNGYAPRPLDYDHVYWDLVLSDDMRPRPDTTSVPLLKLMSDAGFTHNEFQKYSLAKQYSDELALSEYAAMYLVEGSTDEARRNDAIEMLHNEEYHQTKYKIMKAINEFSVLVENRTDERVHQAETMATIMRLIFILLDLLLFYFIWRVSQLIRNILGGSIAQIHSYISHIGIGEYTAPITVPAGHENTILSWLAQTQSKLIALDEARTNTQKTLTIQSQAMEQSPNSIIITDFKANIEYVNTAFIQNTGYTLEDVLGQNPRLLKSGNTPEHAYDSMWEALVRQEKWQGEFINKRKDGSTYIYSINVAPVLDNEGKTTHYIAIEEDISEQKKTQEKIHYLANFDTLTGLPNRIQMDDHLQYTLNLARRNEGKFALIFLDLDHFKIINDTLGHNMGDLLLIEVAKRLNTVLRDEDTVSRMGGDEFILLLPETTANGAAQVAQKILASITLPFIFQDHELSVTASLGIALYPSDGTDIETLSKNADTAMYRAKQEGRNAYCFFTNEMQKNSQRTLKISNALHSALERNEFHLVYQPQLNANDGTVIGAEALIRWEHPQLGTVSPAEFIPIAEDNGMILSIGEWVLHTAVSQAALWNKNGIKLIIAINLSAAQFRDQRLPSIISGILEETGLPPQNLEIELTESVAMYDPQNAIKIMNILHEIGIRMSIDDFGTGYSSLSYLKQFKVYKLKIDQSFVRDISTDPEDKAIVNAVIQLAHSLELVTIAEGVETIDQLQYLQQQGCDEIQGYYYSKPVLAKIFEDFYKTHSRNTEMKE